MLPKANKPAFAYFCILLCISCGDPSLTLSPELLECDKRVSVNPDSVLDIVRGPAQKVLQSGSSPGPDALFELFLYGKALFLAGQLDSAHQTALKGIELTEGDRYPWLAGKFYGQAGYKHTVTGQFDSAAWYFSHSKYFFARSGDSVEMFKSIVNWGTAESKAHHRTKSLRWAMRDAVNYYKRIQQPVSIALAAANLASRYGDDAVRDSATYYWALAESHMDAVMPAQRPQLWLNLGIWAEKDSLYDKAMGYYRRAEQAHVANARVTRALACNKAILLNKTGKPDSALMILSNLVKNTADEQDFRDLDQLAWNEMADIYEKRGDWEHAFLSYRNAAVLSDSLIGWESQAHLSDIRSEYDQLEKEWDIKLKNEKIWWSNALLAVAVMALAALFYALQNRKKMLKMERINAALLGQKNTELIADNQHLTEQVQTLHVENRSEQEIVGVLKLNNRESTILPLNDVKYVVAGEGGVYFFTHTSTEPVFNWQSLKSCSEMLPAQHFVQISKNTIVSKREIVGKTSTIIRLRSGETLSVGTAYKANLNEN